MKILVDMNLSPRWVTELQSRGFEAIHWSHIGEATAPDSEVAGWCADHAHILFTHDLDFGAILAASQDIRPSVVQLRVLDVTPEAMLGRVTETLSRTERELLRGAFVTIEPARDRIRLLPLPGR